MENEMMRKRVRLFNAFSHPLRLKILQKLRKGPCCVCEIIPHVGGEQSNVSHHLAILRNADIVRRDKRGLEVWYGVVCPEIFEIIDRADGIVMAGLLASSKVLETLADREQ